MGIELQTGVPGRATAFLCGLAQGACWIPRSQETEGFAWATAQNRACDPTCGLLTSLLSFISLEQPPPPVAVIWDVSAGSAEDV